MHVLCSSGATPGCVSWARVSRWLGMCWAYAGRPPSTIVTCRTQHGMSSVHHLTQLLDKAPGGQTQVLMLAWKCVIKEATSTAHQVLTSSNPNLRFHLLVTHLFHVLIVQCFRWLQVGPGGFNLFPFRPQDAQVILEIKERKLGNWMHPMRRASASQCLLKKWQRAFVNVALWVFTPLLPALSGDYSHSLCSPAKLD